MRAVKTCTEICLLILLTAPACARNGRQEAVAESSPAQIELREAKIKLYHRGRLMLEAEASTLRAEELNRLWQAEGVLAVIRESELP